MAQPAKAAVGRPPDKGSFPLDHHAECKGAMEAYMECMRDHGMQAGLCREETGAYLKCRMSKNLMAREDLDKLGIHVVAARAQQHPVQTSDSGPPQREIVAGLERIKASRELQGR